MPSSSSSPPSSPPPPEGGRKLLSASSLLGKTREQVLYRAVVAAHMVLLGRPSVRIVRIYIRMLRQVSACLIPSFTFLNHYLTILMGRFRRRRLHVMLNIDNLGIRMRSLNPRDCSLNLRSGFNCPM